MQPHRSRRRAWQPVVQELFVDRPDAPPPTRQYLYELHDVITR